MRRKWKMVTVISMDIVMIILSTLYTNLLYYHQSVSDFGFSYELMGQIVFYLVYGSVLKIFIQLNRYFNLNISYRIFASVFLSYGTLAMFLLAFRETNLYMFAVLFLTSVVSFALIILLRVIMHQTIIHMEILKKEKTKKNNLEVNTLILGAGKTALHFLSELNGNNEERLKVIGLLDDDSNKKDSCINQYKVFGTIDELDGIVSKYQIKKVVIAIPSLSNQRLKKIISLLQELHLNYSVVPSLSYNKKNRKQLELKELNLLNIMNRKEISFETETSDGLLSNSTVLVTGAGGSIGSEICRQLINYNVKTLLLLGHGENSIHKIFEELKKNEGTHSIPIIADIQDRDRIDEIMGLYQPDFVYHAAAHKHVPMMEMNPAEAVKNNVYGTKNVAELAKKHKVKKFVMVSTDKAVNTKNVMGATKRISEMIVTSLNGKEDTKFSATRFGNVLGSRGSVIPLFLEQLKMGGPITVTDFRMTRYFMTIPEASSLVIKSSILANGGEVFILDMGEPVKIVDLASKLINFYGYGKNEIEIIETGIRPGEKLYEELLTKGEYVEKEVDEKIFMSKVKFFTIEEIERFLETLPSNTTELTQRLIEFANKSTRE